MPRLHCIIKGRVQGVGFRAFVCQEARNLSLSGWVRNTPDREVEVCANGPREYLELLLSHLEEGPWLAHVDKVTPSWLETNDPHPHERRADYHF